MAVSDPTMAVPTPTGALQGVAACSWDGSAWQPAGRAGPSVATSTGVLQGIAPFTWDGSAWQPVGRAGPGVATATGVLDGVAVYTWSGTAWVPASGTATPSTPSGALRGVAAFNWDGAAWQPAAQAGPSVATPYGVLQGVAMFSWSGNAWVAAGPSLDLNFMIPGSMPAGITFTRASTATYLDAAGVMQTATANTPRWDYDPVTYVLRGLLIEEARTNVVLNSGDASNASWPKGNIIVAAPVVTGNQIASPAGTITAARVVYPLVSGAGAASNLGLTAGTVATAAPYTLSIWARGAVGGERVYLSLTPDGTLFYRVQMNLTTSWQRFTLTTPNLTAVTWYPAIGCDLRDASQTSTPAQTIYVWGAQIELGAFPTSYIPTTTTATRAVEVANTTPLGAWFNASTGSFVYEFDTRNSGAVAGGFSSGAFANVIYLNVGASGVSGNIASAGFGVAATGVSTSGSVQKMSAAYSTGRIAACNNGGAVGTAGLAVSPYPWTSNMTFGGAPWAPSGSGQIGGHLRRVRYWPRALTDAELQAVTT